MGLPELSDREVEILDAYLRCASKSGVESVTLQKVAAEAKIAFSTVRYYFAGKPYTLAEFAAFSIVKEIQAFTQEFIAKKKARDGHDGIKTHIRASFEWIAANPIKSKHLLYFYYLNAYKPKFPMRANTLFNVARDRFESLIHEGIGRGIYPKADDPRELATQVHTLLIGGLTLAMMEPSIKVWKKCLESVLEGASMLICPRGELPSGPKRSE